VWIQEVAKARGRDQSDPPAPSLNQAIGADGRTMLQALHGRGRNAVLASQRPKTFDDGLVGEVGRRGGLVTVERPRSDLIRKEVGERAPDIHPDNPRHARYPTPVRQSARSS
jgi:hypothetical protein